MTYDDIWRRLLSLYDAGEAKAMARQLLEDLFGLSFADILSGGTSRLSVADNNALESAVGRLLRAEPLQYVVGRCQFCGHDFEVNHNVLIPRPETEWLVDAAVASVSAPTCAILDVGTGSGCIAISMALALAGKASVEAWDISHDALDVARRNAELLGAEVAFCERDALRLAPEEGKWDIIVSNPPYICHRESADMAPNVLNHEPHGALFVPDDDALLFYRAIATYAKTALRRGGTLLFECNTLYAADTEAMLRDMGFAHTAVADDCFGKPRFVKGTQCTN